MSRETPYDDHFYDAIVDTSAASARRIAPFLIELVAPRSVVDVGCGTGAWLARFIEAGITDVLGIDGAYVDPDRLQIPVERFRAVDLEHPPDLGRTFDLAICFEVAEHLPDTAAEGLVELLTSLAPAVVFSAAIPGQGGNHHVNERWLDEWVERFVTRGFVPLDCLRARFWNDDDVAPYYAQNALLYVREDHPSRHEAEGLVSPMPYRVVHPGVFKLHTTPIGFGDALRELPGALRRSLVYRRRR